MSKSINSFFALVAMTVGFLSQASFAFTTQAVRNSEVLNSMRTSSIEQQRESTASELSREEIQSQTVVSCRSAWGAQLCNQMELASQSYNLACSGTYCRDLWGQQLEQVTLVSDQFLSWVSPDARVEVSFAQRAQFLASLICRTQRRFGPQERDLVVKLVLMENQLISQLYSAQKRAGLSPVFCQVTIRE